MTPILNLPSLFDSISPAALLWWLSRVTLIATLGCAFLTFAYRARPAVRHAVAVGSLFAIALLPVASALLPAWSLPVLPARIVQRAETPRAQAFAIDAARPSRAKRFVAVPASLEPATVTTGSVATPTAKTSFFPRVNWPGADWRGVLLLIWLNVSVALILRSALAAMAARRLVDGSFAPRSENILLECDRARRMLGITRPVDVSVSPDTAVPLVVGALHARVILPMAASSWSHERLSAVLLHECAHARRRDNLWVLTASLVSAVFWFHPLVWMLSGQVRREAERACDDIVLAHGVRGSDYATHLVAIARTAVTREAIVGAALTFATRSSLEKRVVAILSARTPRAAMSRRALVLLACVSMVLTAAIATAHPTPGPAGKQKKEPKQKVYMVKDQERESGRDYYSEAGELYNRGRYSRAAEAFSRAAELGYRRPTALYNAGCSYALAGSTDDAIEVLRAAFDEGFDRPELYASDDDLNSLRGDKRFQQLMADVMKSDAAQLDRRDANREFDRLAKRDNVEEGEWNSVGIDLLRSGDYEHSADAFDREFKLSGDEDALYNMACARAQGGKKDAALMLLEQSITSGSVDAEHMQEDPDLITLHDNKRFDELVTMAEDLTLSSSWRHDNKWRWNWHGDDERAWRKSLSHYEEMANKYPKLGRAWFNLGFAQLRAEEAEKSTASFQKALDLGYKKPTTMYNLACCAAQTGNTDAAFDWLERADAAGFDSWWHAYTDDDLDPIRSDSRFKQYKRRWKKSDMSFHFNFNDYDNDNDTDEDDDTDNAN